MQFKLNYLQGISGGAFKIFWELPWSVKHTFAALGYDYTFIPDYFPEQRPPNFMRVFRKKIVDSINSERSFQISWGFLWR